MLFYKSVSLKFLNYENKLDQPFDSTYKLCAYNRIVSYIDLLVLFVKTLIKILDKTDKTRN